MHPRHRRRGHFRALYEYVKERARSENAVGIRLYVDVGNSKAQSTVILCNATSHLRNAGSQILRLIFTTADDNEFAITPESTWGLYKWGCWLSNPPDVNYEYTVLNC